MNPAHPNPFIKPTDSFLARHFDRKISWAITQRLAKTSVTPNQVTAASVAMGLAGASFLACPHGSVPLVGTLILWVHGVVDGCDGELARLKRMQSRLGQVLDFFGDNLVHLALFSFLGYGLWRLHANPLYLGLALSACLGTLGSALLYFPRQREVSAEPSSSDRPFRLHFTDRIAQRDFLYALPLLALFGKLHWFLWASAVGAPVFFFVLAARRASSFSAGR